MGCLIKDLIKIAESVSMNKKCHRTRISLSVALHYRGSFVCKFVFKRLSYFLLLRVASFKNLL